MQLRVYAHVRLRFGLRQSAWLAHGMVHLVGTWARQRDTVAPLETRVFH